MLEVMEITGIHEKWQSEEIEKIILEKNSNLKLNLGYFEYNLYEPFAFWGSNKYNLLID